MHLATLQQNIVNKQNLILISENMIICVLLIVNSLFIASEQNSHSEYCDISTKSCHNDYNLENTKYLFYDVNPPEGFNLRRDVYMRFAIMLSEAHKKSKKLHWQLVLPPWFRLYHWKSENHNPIPWARFFNVESLQTFAPVVEMHEVFSKTKGSELKIDTLYVLQNFDNPFEGGTFVDKWEINNQDCNYYGGFWGYKNISAKEVICVRFQGQASKLWELISLHTNDKKVMFAHGEIALHDSYGTKHYWDCRKSMKFNKHLLDTAQKYILENFNCNDKQCESYMSIHWRRQDFARSRKSDVPSLSGTVKQIDAVFKKIKPKIKNIFIATDASMSELMQLEKQLKDLAYKVYFYLPSDSQLETFKDGGIAIIDQIICSHAAYFIGTHESTFSFRIQEEREILGFDSKTTFNRFCPDTGPCERPSKWTILN